jgi:hypothetical protein
MPSVPFDAIATGYDRAMPRVSEPFVPDLLAACAFDAATSSSTGARGPA